MSDFRLDFGPDRVKIDHVIAIEDGLLDDGNVRVMRDFLAQYVVNGGGEPVAESEARAYIGQFTLAQLAATMTRFEAMFDQAKADAVNPPPNGS